MMILRTITQILIAALCVTGTGALIYQLYLTVLDVRSRNRVRREYLEEIRKIRKALEDDRYEDRTSH